MEYSSIDIYSDHTHFYSSNGKMFFVLCYKKKNLKKIIILNTLEPSIITRMFFAFIKCLKNY